MGVFRPCRSLRNRWDHLSGDPRMRSPAGGVQQHPVPDQRPSRTASGEFKSPEQEKSSEYSGLSIE